MTLDLARWQFAVVTIFHFFFVPLTIGLSFLVAIMQTLAYRQKDPGWDRLSRFFGRLFLINLAVGVVTGHRPRVPVRPELVLVLGLRRQHLRGPARHRGPAGVLPGVDLRRPVDLRAGTPLGPPAPRHDLAGRRRHGALGAVHPRRQRLDAAPGRLQGRPRSGGAHELLADPRQLHPVGPVRPHRARRLRHGGGPHARHQRLAGAPRPGRSRQSPRLPAAAPTSPRVSC